MIELLDDEITFLWDDGIRVVIQLKSEDAANLFDLIEQHGMPNNIEATKWVTGVGWETETNGQTP